MQRTDEAEAIYQRVIGLADTNPGVDDAAMASGLNNLGTLLMSQPGRLEEARSHLTRALSVLETTHEVQDHPDAIRTRLR